jgi:hypothetical protein
VGHGGLPGGQRWWWCRSPVHDRSPRMAVDVCVGKRFPATQATPVST